MPYWLALRSPPPKPLPTELPWWQGGRAASLSIAATRQASDAARADVQATATVEGASFVSTKAASRAGIAGVPANTAISPPTPSPSVLQADGPMALATWALQFTPRVALLEEAVVMEVEASLRLFGGASALRRRMRDDAQLLGCERMAWAPTGLAALACMRVMQPNGFAGEFADVLDALPLETVTAVAEHEPTLARLGCQTLGHVRALPRGGLSRRFGQPLLDGLDLAYGLRPESHAWLAIPDTFQATLELPGRVETAPALMFGAQRLLMLRRHLADLPAADLPIAPQLQRCVLDLVSLRQRGRPLPRIGGQRGPAAACIDKGACDRLLVSVVARHGDYPFPILLERAAWISRKPVSKTLSRDRTAHADGDCRRWQSMAMTAWWENMTSR